MLVVKRSEFTTDELRQQLRRCLTAGEIAEIERAAWQVVLDELVNQSGRDGVKLIQG